MSEPTIIPDTDTPLTVAQMTAAFDRLMPELQAKCAEQQAGVKEKQNRLGLLTDTTGITMDVGFEI